MKQDPEVYMWFEGKLAWGRKRHTLHGWLVSLMCVRFRFRQTRCEAEHHHWLFYSSDKCFESFSYYLFNKEKWLELGDAEREELISVLKNCSLLPVLWFHWLIKGLWGIKWSRRYLLFNTSAPRQHRRAVNSVGKLLQWSPAEWGFVSAAKM